MSDATTLPICKGLRSLLVQCTGFDFSNAEFVGNAPDPKSFMRDLETG